MVRLLIVEPGYCPYAANFDTVEEAVTQVLNGSHLLLKPFDTPKIGLLCSQHSEGLRFNRVINEDGTYIKGRFIICGLHEQKPSGLTKEQADRYSRLFFQPQTEHPDSEDFPLAKVRPMDERFGKKLHFWER